MIIDRFRVIEDVSPEVPATLLHFTERGIPSPELYGLPAAQEDVNRRQMALAGVRLAVNSFDKVAYALALTWFTKAELAVVCGDWSCFQKMTSTIVALGLSTYMEPPRRPPYPVEADTLPPRVLSLLPDPDAASVTDVIDAARTAELRTAEAWEVQKWVIRARREEMQAAIAARSD